MGTGILTKKSIDNQDNINMLRENEICKTLFDYNFFKL